MPHPDALTDVHLDVPFTTAIMLGLPLFLHFFQKEPDVHHFSARDSGAGNGCANFVGAWHFLVLSAGIAPHAHKIPRFRGGGGVVGFLEGGGGGSANF